MAIAAVNAKYLTQGPALSGQVLASVDQASSEVSLPYIATATLDGSSTSFVLNFIDGTQTLNFTPRAVTADVVGGTQAAATVVSVSTQTPTGAVSVTVNIGAAGTAANTLTIAGFILK